jgi:hypothetical protein
MKSAAPPLAVRHRRIEQVAIKRAGRDQQDTTVFRRRDKVGRPAGSGTTSPIKQVAIKRAGPAANGRPRRTKKVTRSSGNGLASAVSGVIALLWPAFLRNSIKHCQIRSTLCERTSLG